MRWKSKRAICIEIETSRFPMGLFVQIPCHFIARSERALIAFEHERYSTIATTIAITIAITTTITTTIATTIYVRPPMFIPSLSVGCRELAFVALVASPTGFNVIIKISVICGAVFTVEARKYLPLITGTTHIVFGLGFLYVLLLLWIVQWWK